jgi:hypothetical protein
MVKCAIAAIPAFLILAILGGIVSLIFAVAFGAVYWRVSGFASVRGHIWILGLMGLPRLDNTGRLEMLDASTQSPGTWLGPALTSLRGSGRMCRTLPELRERPGKATV